MKVTIFFEEEFLGVYPSIINCITLLCPVSSSVVIVSSERESNFPKPPRFAKNVSFLKVPQKLNYNRNHFETKDDTTTPLNKSEGVSHSWKMLVPESLKIIFRDNRNLIRENLLNWQLQYSWFREKLSYYFFCLCNTRKKNQDIIIAIDESGLIAGLLVRMFSKEPKPKIIFWSLETGLVIGKSSLFLLRFHELLFSLSCRFTDIVVTQEESRLADLEKKISHKIRSVPKIFIPHSPLGRSNEKNCNSRSDFFHKMFSLSKIDKVILHAGWIHDGMCVDKIALSSKLWKPEFRLVLHEREKRSPKEDFIRHVSKLSGNRALLSLNPVTFDRIDEVISSAHIGLIAYDSKYGAGRVNIRKSSGKLAQYLKCGVPVIALKLPGYEEMFTKYKCGLVFESFDQIENCIDTIMAEYQSFSVEALRCFSEEFDFNKFFSPLLNHLENIKSSKTI
jgi:glycosyltransferase involved in cell wall biosynthesis